MRMMLLVLRGVLEVLLLHTKELVHGVVRRTLETTLLLTTRCLSMASGEGHGSEWRRRRWEAQLLCLHLHLLVMLLLLQLGVELRLQLVLQQGDLRRRQERNAASPLHLQACGGCSTPVGCKVHAAGLRPSSSV